jgi:hypothetical protein
VLMLIFIVIFNPKFYTFADLILPKYSFNWYNIVDFKEKIGL